MKLNRLLIIALAVAMIFGSASTILAKHARALHGPHAMDLKGLMEELDLSEEQRAQVEVIVVKYEDDRNNLAESLKEARDALEGVIFAEPYDEAAVRQAAQQVSTIREELAVLQAKMIAELRTVLTPEQMGYLKGRWEAKKGFGKHRRPMRGR